MYQVIKQTDEEKLAMYMKTPKKELAKMLLQCNKILDSEYYGKGISEYTFSSNQEVYSHNRFPFKNRIND